MSLLSTLCPSGVPYKPLSEVCKVITAPKKLEKKDYQAEGAYPIIDQGQKYIIAYTDDTTALVAKGEYVIFGDHTREVKYVDFAFAQGADGLKILVANADVLPKYLYYAMTDMQIASRGYNRHWSIAKDILLPLPPLPIQQQIVSILDKFSQLSAELEAELELRKKQYDYYRNRLLSFDPASAAPDTTDGAHAAAFLNGNDAAYHKGFYPLLVKEALEAKELSAIPEIKWVKLGEIGEMIKGNGIQKKDFQESGVPCIHYGQVYTHYNTFADKTISFIDENLAKKCRKAHTGDLVIATTSENIEDCCKAVAWLGEEDVAVSGDAHIFRHNQNPKYIAYLFQTEMFFQQKRHAATGTKVIRVSGDSMLNFSFPLPPLPIQQRIVSILDKFEQLTTDLQDGLPAEIRLVRRQYEYYRTRLLTFDKN